MNAPRNLALERQWTAEAARVGGTTSEALSTMAERRAGPGSVSDIDMRNFGHEVLEEIADARNYLVWWLEQVARGSRRHPHLTGELTIAISRTLAAVTVAFAHAHEANSLMSDWERAAA